MESQRLAALHGPIFWWINLELENSLAASSFMEFSHLSSSSPYSTIIFRDLKPLSTISSSILEIFDFSGLQNEVLGRETNSMVVLIGL